MIAVSSLPVAVVGRTSHRSFLSSATRIEDGARPSRSSSAVAKRIGDRQEEALDDPLGVHLGRIDRVHGHGRQVLVVGAGGAGEQEPRGAGDGSRRHLEGDGAEVDLAAFGTDDPGRQAGRRRGRRRRGAGGRRVGRRRVRGRGIRGRRGPVGAGSVGAGSVGAGVGAGGGSVGAGSVGAGGGSVGVGGGSVGAGLSSSGPGAAGAAPGSVREVSDAPATASPENGLPPIGPKAMVRAATRVVASTPGRAVCPPVDPRRVIRKPFRS